jgi:hypothetical protein
MHHPAVLPLHSFVANFASPNHSHPRPSHLSARPQCTCQLRASIARPPPLHPGRPASARPPLSTPPSGKCRPHPDLESANPVPTIPNPSPSRPISSLRPPTGPPQPGGQPAPWRPTLVGVADPEGHGEGASHVEGHPPLRPPPLSPPPRCTRAPTPAPAHVRPAPPHRAHTRAWTNPLPDSWPTPRQGFALAHLSSSSVPAPAPWAPSAPGPHPRGPWAPVEDLAGPPAPGPLPLLTPLFVEPATGARGAAWRKLPCSWWAALSPEGPAAARGPAAAAAGAVGDSGAAPPSSICGRRERHRGQVALCEGGKRVGQAGVCSPCRFPRPPPHICTPHDEVGAPCIPPTR